MRKTVFLLLAATMLSACQASSEQPASDPSGPDSKAEMCRAIGKDPETEPRCNYANDGVLRKLLFEAFPIGVATQSDVHDRLGVYFLSTTAPTSAPYVLDTYAIEQTLFSEWPVVAIFSFDHDGVLRQIDVVDIL